MVCGLQVWLGFILPASTHPFYGFILRVAWVGPAVGLSWFIRWNCIECGLLWMCVEGIWRNGSTSSIKPSSRSGRQSSGGVRKINAGNVVRIEFTRVNLLFFGLTPSALLLIKSILPPFNYHRRLTRFLGSDASLASVTDGEVVSN